MEGNRSLAIVLGASISGLLDARVLSRHFDRVLLVERDVLADCAEVRKGAAQAAHAHGLLASGYRLLDEYFPGLLDELRALGAPPPTWGDEGPASLRDRRLGRGMPRRFREGRLR